MTQSFHFLELDDASRDYLLSARDRQGEGMPGVFVHQGSYLPVAGFIIGILLILAVVIVTFATSVLLDDPLNVAMLQTAGLLLGGWMIVAAVRVWAVSGSRRYLGHFLWVDPVRLWEASGSRVTVTDMADLRSATGTENFNEGTYQNTAIELTLPDRNYTFTVSKQAEAERLLRFFNALTLLREAAAAAEQTNRPSAAMIGSMARDLALGEPPTLEAAEESEAREPATPLPEPHRARRAPSGLLAYALIIVAGVACVFALRSVNVGLRDDAMFDVVKTLRPPMLRAYLVDPRNTRHREQVQQILASHYATRIEMVKGRGQDKEMTDQFVVVLESLKTAVHPIISIRAREEVKAPQEEKDFPEHEVRIRQGIIQKQLGDWLCGIVGDDLIIFVQAPEDVPPMLEIVYRFVPDENRPGSCRLEWKTLLRTGPDDAQPRSKTHPPQEGILVGANSFQAAVDNAARQTVTDMAGPPVNPQPQPGFPFQLPPGFNP